MIDDAGMNQIVAKRIKDRLRELGKTQGWLAEKMSVSINAVSRWTKLGKISRENAVEAARHLEMSLDELIGGESPGLTLVERSPSRLDRLDQEEAELLQLFRRSNEAGRKMIFANARVVSEQMPRTDGLLDHKS